MIIDIKPEEANRLLKLAKIGGRYQIAEKLEMAIRGLKVEARAQLLDWIGDDDREEKLIDLLTSMLNGEYTIEELRGDIKKYE